MTTSNEAQSYESGQISPVFNHLWHHDARPTNPLSSLLATANLGDHREPLSQGTQRLRSLGSVAPLEFSGEKQRGRSSRCRILALECAIHLHTLTCLIKEVWPLPTGHPPNAPYQFPSKDKLKCQDPQLPGHSARNRPPPGTCPNLCLDSPCLQTFIRSPDVQIKLMRDYNQVHAVSPRSKFQSIPRFSRSLREFCTCIYSFSSQGAGINCAALHNDLGSCLPRSSVTKPHHAPLLHSRDIQAHV